MNNIARNYSTALFEIAKKYNILKEVNDQLQDISNLCTNSEINRFFCSKAIDYSLKEKILTKLQSKINLHIITINFMHIVIKNNKFFLWEDILTLFSKTFNEFAGIMVIQVTSSQPLTEDDKNTLINQLQKEYNKIIKATFVLDRSIIAGLIIHCTEINKLLDLSLATNLKNIEMNLLNNKCA